MLTSCSKKTEMYEGSLIRAFRLLVEVLRQMVQASKAIGNTELENKFAAAITAIKRDIVFAPSLVYPVHSPAANFLVFITASYTFYL